jgi:hypothetical protein
MFARCNFPTVREEGDALIADEPKSRPNNHRCSASLQVLTSAWQFPYLLVSCCNCYRVRFDTEEVAGSNPVVPTIFINNLHGIRH